MKKCIDCGVELTETNKSPHQPSIRCRRCFGFFADGVTAVLGGTATNARECGLRAAKAAGGES